MLFHLCFLLLCSDSTYPHCLLMLAYSLNLYTSLSLLISPSLPLSTKTHLLLSLFLHSLKTVPPHVCLYCSLLPYIQISIIHTDGVYFKKSKYSILVDADLPKNTPVFSLQNEMILDRTAVQDMLSFQFTREAKF